MNDWYKDFSIDRSGQEKTSSCPNKRAFYNWLKKKAQNACEKHWAEQNSKKESDFRYSIHIDEYIGSAEQVTIPAQIDDLPVTCIGDKAFSWCESLQSIIIPNSVTFIDNGAFNGCISLTEITIPDSVEYIKDEAFSGCEHLEAIYINAATLSRGSVRRSINAIREQNPSCKILPIPTE